MSIPLLSFSQIRFPEPATNLDWYFISGPLAPPEQGDDDHHQTFYLSIPVTFEDPFSISLIHPSCFELPDQVAGKPDSKFSISVFGGTGLYLPEQSQLIAEGNLLFRQEFGPYDSLVKSPPISPHHGELTLDREKRFFRIEVNAIEGDDGNAYALEINTASMENLPKDEVSLLSNNISFMLPENPNDVGHIFIHVPSKGMGITLWNFDWDEDGQIRISSLARNGQFIFASGDGNSKVAMLKLFKEEQGNVLDLQIIKRKSKPLKSNPVSLKWIIEDSEGNNISLPLPVRDSAGKTGRSVK